jgi:hypothetical protein
VHPKKQTAGLVDPRFAGGERDDLRRPVKPPPTTYTFSEHREFVDPESGNKKFRISAVNQIK